MRSVFIWSFFLLLVPLSCIEAMEEEEPEARKAREKFSHKTLSTPKSDSPTAATDEDLKPEDTWVIVDPASRSPNILFRDWILERDPLKTLLPCKIHYQPGPAERIFDEDPTQGFSPYFKVAHFSSISLTPLSLWICSDPNTLAQTRGNPERAIGSLQLIFIAWHALGDLKEDRSEESRVYQLNEENLKKLGASLLRETLTRESKTEEDLRNPNVIAQITRTLTTTILKELLYSAQAIENLSRLAEDLQVRKAEATAIPATYKALEEMYEEEVGKTV